jgi:hypothetical protein
MSRSYTIKRADLRGKLLIDNALIQTGLDSGWGGLLATGDKPLEQLSASERNYLKHSALSYIGAGDPVLISRFEQYYVI